ncbi:ParB N-terminal domain-containing protein [Winogradskyella aurantiaca]|uniref:hypothetical protein n=1 Tax=Winogradskyella aurantiaca TaxID=2219558 RepID=UPI000E1D310F|nr:hypothetical protein [Winogradskyella aurantiaca]
MKLKTIEEELKKIKAAGSNVTFPLYYKGKKRNLEVYEVPVELLRFNYLNGRIGTEVREFAITNGQKLEDLSIDEINGKIHNWIWEKSKNENKKTLEDIERKRQIIPGIITRDGIVVDGNRRFMIARELNKKGLNRQFLTIILDDTYEDGGDNALQIKKLETEIQLGQDEKVKYGAIEQYIKIMDFIDNYIEVKSPKMTYEELVRLMNIKGKEKELKKKYRTGKLMLEYLKYIGFPEMFSRLQNTEDLFLQLETIYGLYKDGKGIAGWNFSEVDVKNYKYIGFDLIRWNYNASNKNKGDWEAKKIRDKYFKNSATKTIFSNPKIWRDFQANIEDVEDIEIPSLTEIVQKKGVSDADAARAIDKLWADSAAPIFKKALGSAEKRLIDKQNKDRPSEFIKDALDKLGNLVNEDLLYVEGKVVFNDGVLSILKHEDKIDENYLKVDKIRKIAECLKKNLR